jgi:ribosomal protein S18 acetylase RimI-like enzyme
MAYPPTGSAYHGDLTKIREIALFNEITDMASVKYIYQECFQPPYTLDMLEARIASAEKVWVYLINGEIVGYLLLDVDRKVHYLSQVATRSTARHIGVATGLIRNAEQYLQSLGVKKWWLQTGHDNPAQKLYFDIGFRVSGFQKHLYGVNSHGIEMTKYLD